jgi:hypothetical protein
MKNVCYLHHNDFLIFEQRLCAYSIDPLLFITDVLCRWRNMQLKPQPGLFQVYKKNKIVKVYYGSKLACLFLHLIFFSCRSVSGIFSR